MAKYKHLFSPITVNGMTVKNRIIMSPVGSNLAESDGQMSAEHIEYYRLRAAGGVGLAILENVCVDFPKGSNGTTQLRLDHDCYIPRLFTFNETMHKYGCCTSVQLNHAGSLTVPERIGGAPVSPSPVKLADGSMTEELSVEEIKRLVVQFGKAAVRAKFAGFDAVELHAGHGYLVDQFLSPVRNRRTDEYGGSWENRARFCKEILQEIRRVLGPRFPIMIRLSLDEFVEGGSSIEDSLKMMESFVEYVDLVDASVGLRYAMDPAQMPDGWRRYVAKAVKERFNVPAAVMGNIRLPEVAEDIIASGDSDFVVIGRGLLADPQWPMKVQAGREAEVRPCISCNAACVGHRMGLNRPIRCAVNPSALTEEWHKLNKVKKDCNVVVVGGGISGLEAACTAAETGCRVTLIEKEAELGGWVRKIAALPMKYRMQRLLDYELLRAKNLKNLVCLTGMTATPELIETFKPDLVVWSTGSGTLLPPIKGLHENMNDAAAPVTDIAGLLKDLENADKITGKTVGVAGGGAVALDVAEFFAERGNHVFMVEMMPDVGMGMDRFSKDYFMKVLTENNAEIFRSHKLEEVKKNAFVVSTEGETKELPFDYGFICLGLRANREGCSEMREYFEDRNILFTEIGDCVRARRIFEGVTEGRNIVELLKIHGFYQ